MTRESSHLERSLDDRVGLWPRRVLSPTSSPLGDYYHGGIPSQDTIETLFPPIADYAILSDCENSLLIAPTGAIEWMCIPKPNDPSVFGTLLDRAAGSFRLGAGRQRGAGPPSVRTWHHGARHHVADPQRLADRQ